MNETRIAFSHHVRFKTFGAMAAATPWDSESHRHRSSRVLVVVDDSAEDACAQELARRALGQDWRRFRGFGRPLVS